MVTLKKTNPKIYPVWDFKLFKNSWLIRTDNGIYSLDKDNDSVNWFVEVLNENMFSFKPMVLIENTLVYTAYLPNEKETYLKAIDAHNGNLIWETTLNWRKLSHMSGILVLKNEIILLDWIKRGEKEVALYRFSGQTGEKKGDIPAIRLNPNSLAIYGAKVAVSTANYVYFCQKNEHVYQFDLSFNTLKPIISGRVQQIISNADILIVHLWENKQDILYKLHDKSGRTEKFILELSAEENIESFTLLQTAQNVALLAVLLENYQGMVLVDVNSSHKKWCFGDGKTRFSYAIWTPYGIACIVHKKNEKSYDSEVWLLDEQNGTLIETIKPPLLENWLGWQNNSLLISSERGLLFYELGEN